MQSRLTLPSTVKMCLVAAPAGKLGPQSDEGDSASLALDCIIADSGSCSACTHACKSSCVHACSCSCP